MNLVIDIGNSRIKIAVFDGDAQVFLHEEEKPDPEILQQLIARYSIDSLIYTSVRADEYFDFSRFSSGIRVFKFSHSLKLPIQNRYKTPHTLGLDRLAGVIGAHQQFPGQAALVIDSGTCITFDLVDDKGIYQGGSIAPGLQMRLRAMHQFTGKLPEITLDAFFDETKSYGADTREAMLSGAVNGILYEIEGYIRFFQGKYPDLKVILCGGDASFFDTRLKNSIFALHIMLQPHLVLAGLNTVVNDQHD